MRRILSTLLLFFALNGLLTIVQPQVTAQSCVGAGSQCADALGNPTSTCCPGTRCVAEPQGLFSICETSTPPTDTQQPVTQPTTTVPTDSDTQSTSGDGVLCNGTNEINTAVGCIPFDDPTALTGFVLRWAIGIAGGIAFLLIIYAGFLITTSQGDPKRLQAGRELLTSAIGGLLLLIFSVFILRVIGVDILQIPGLGTQ